MLDSYFEIITSRVERHTALVLLSMEFNVREPSLKRLSNESILI